jgi:hypothetical protein
VLVAPRRASSVRDLKDLPDHLGRRFLEAAGTSGTVEAELGLVVFSGLRRLYLALVLALFLPMLPLPLAAVVLLAFFALLALLATLLVGGLAAACLRPPRSGSGVGDLSIEGATTRRGEVWLAVSNASAGLEFGVKGGAVGPLMFLL